MTTLVLIRHGETEWNRIGRWQGHADVPLSDRGRDQARRVAARLLAEEQPFDHLYASDLARAFETASIIGSALALPIHPLIELREMHVGAWSGLTRDDIRVQYPEQWSLYAAGGDGPRGGHGETNEALRARVVDILERLVRDHPRQRLLVVSHGGPIRALVSHIGRLTGLPADLQIENTSITEVRFAEATPQILRVNDCSHCVHATAIDPTAR